jgi:uncharacterized protein
MGSLSTTAPSAGSMSFPYDPNDPSPTVGGGTLLPTLKHGPRSQSDVLSRKDIAVFTTPVFDQPMTIAGAISISLDVATTGDDTDVAVRLTDIDASGTQLLIDDGIRRLKLHAGYAGPSPVAPNTRVTLQVPLIGDLAYTFAAGHRLGLIVSGSNYPLWDKNPNNGENFVSSTPTKAVTTTVFTDGTSQITLPLQ